MRIGLFIPCYVDQFYPHVGMATVEILRRLGLDFHFPDDQTCCGQPMANTGCTPDTRPLAERFLAIFRPYTHVVCPSASCVSMVRHHYAEYLSGRDGFEELRRKTFELCEFLTDVIGIDRLAGRFPHRVGLHQSCHGLRELRLGSSSELIGPAFNKVERLLENLEGIEFSRLTRPDECCGFGGTFAVVEEAVSCRMGLDRLQDHLRAGTQVLASADVSCMMHLDGLARRQKYPIRFMHIAEVLVESGAMASGPGKPR